jgi:amino acid transporter
VRAAPPSGVGRRFGGGTRRAGKHADAGHDLDVPRGLAALSLDALSSVAYGPEAIMAVLVAAGASALTWTLPITLVITGMLVLLVISYSQVITAYPDGGGAYAVSKANLGRRPALLAAASLVVDYVLTVAVSLAAGAASLGDHRPHRGGPAAQAIPRDPPQPAGAAARGGAEGADRRDRGHAAVPVARLTAVRCGRWVSATVNCAWEGMGPTTHTW